MDQHSSESLDHSQAIRYGYRPWALPNNRRMETSDERRRRKLEELCLQHGRAEVADRAELSEAGLDQILKGVELPPKKNGGPRSKRGLGDSAARAIEVAFDLDRGWFDNDLGAVDMTAKELQLLGYFRELEPTLQVLVLEKVKETVEQQAHLRESLRLVASPSPAKPNKN